MCKDNIFPEKNNGFQALSGADFLPWSYSAAEKNDYFCDHKIESTMIRQYAGLVKFAHTIFAMPFALVGFVYALRTEGISSDCSGRYGWVVLLLQVLLCMVFARNAAMGFNRWADRRIDKANPRTADRESGRKDQCPGSAPFRDRQCAAVRCHRLDYQFTYRIIIACGTIRYIDI